MTSLAAAGVVVVVEADDFLLEADDFELASDGPGASDPRPIETYRDLWCIVVLTMSQHHCKGLTRSIQNNAKEQRLEQRLRKASKGFTGSTLKAFSYCCPRDGHVPQSTGSGRRVWCLDLN